MSNEATLTIRKDALWKYSTFLLLAILVIGAIFVFTGEKSTTMPVAQQPTQLPSQPTQVKASADDDPFLGDKKAKVEINRKILSELAISSPGAFKKLVKLAQA